MKMRKCVNRLFLRTCIVLGTLSMGTFLMAQTTVTGTVIDGVNNESAIGATVRKLPEGYPVLRKRMADGPLRSQDQKSRLLSRE